MKSLTVLLLFVLVCFTSSRPPVTVKHLGLRQLGKYSGQNDDGIAYEKTYYVSNYLKMTPPQARSFCKSYGPNMDLVTFDSRSEFLVVRTKFEPEVRDLSIFVIIGGFAYTNPNGKTEYHWITTGLKLFSAMDVPSDQKCLGIRKDRNDPVAFAPISCDESLKFLCQEIDIQYAN